MESTNQVVIKLQEQLKASHCQNDQLSSQVSSLKQQIYGKDRKIIHLSQRISQLAAENQLIRKQNKQKDLVLKSQSSALHRKNVELQNCQQNQKKKVEEEILKLKKDIAQLKTIIKQQEIELAQYLKDGQVIVMDFEKVCKKHKYVNEESKILKEFNKQLLRQIEQLENGNQNLITKNAEFEQEIMLQNQQGQDLLCQIETMMDHLEAK